LLLPEDVACNMPLVALQDAGPSESNGINEHMQSKRIEKDQSQL